jgi:hypothetical protein
VRPPISFVYRNLVFGDHVDDVWAVYRVATRSYAGLTRADKREHLALLASFASAIECDFTLLRVARPWSLDQYLAGVEAVSDPRHVRRQLMDEQLQAQREWLGDRVSNRPEVYVCVRIGKPESMVAELARVPGVQALRRAFSIGDPRSISARRLDELLSEEGKVHLRVLDYLDCERAASHELQWLIKRSLCRALEDPEVDGRFAPQALVVDAPEDDGGARYRPLEADVLRLLDAPINIEPRALRIETEVGDSHQALLCLGALPEVVTFPGRRAELLFAPLEAVEFPVDAAFSARFVSNELAVRLVRRRILDADAIFSEESSGEHGPSSRAIGRPRAARELEDYLTGGDHPPMLRASISLCVSAPTPELLEERVERIRREYGEVTLHRPLGSQLALFVGHLPGKGSQVPEYEDYLTVEQLGAMVPTATHAVGSEAGPLVGHTLTGARQPVLFDTAEAPRASRAPATLLSGTLGSGKTLCMELLMYQAFLAGSTICDIDPKGDHKLERLPGVAEHMEVIELAAEERFRGMLDPLRIAPRDTREDLACEFLLNILPEPVAPDWRTELRVAVQAVVAREGRSCGEVVAELERGNAAARDVARALSIHAGSGLARLGFGTADATPRDAGEKPITSLRIRNLTLPLPGTPRAETLEAERISRAILQLLAVYALRLTSADPRRHAVLGFDEAWVLLSDSAGRALIDRISRLGRAQNVTPLLATQVLRDVDELEGLIGAAFCFGVETEHEARRSLGLLGLDEDDVSLQQRLMSFRRGRCMMRDYDGRVGPVKIELGPDLLPALDTRPDRGALDADRPEPQLLPDALAPATD